MSATPGKLTAEQSDLIAANVRIARMAASTLRRRGLPATWDELYASCLYGLCRAIVRPQFRQDVGWEHWLFRAAIWQAYRDLRYVQNLRIGKIEVHQPRPGTILGDVPGEEVDPIEALAAIEEHDALILALKDLTVSERFVVRCRIKGMRSTDIARAMGWVPGSESHIYMQATRKLKAAMGGKE